jgi:hypothetical protein
MKKFRHSYAERQPPDREVQRTQKVLEEARAGLLGPQGPAVAK